MELVNDESCLTSIRPYNAASIDDELSKMRNEVASRLNIDWHPSAEFEKFNFIDLDFPNGIYEIDKFRIEIEKSGWHTYRRGCWLFVSPKPLSLLKRIFLFTQKVRDSEWFPND
jgi:hypothetical protein